MLTQGLVSITNNGETVLKAVCGCNGQHAVLLARLIRERHLCSVEEVYHAALSVEFGCPACLVVFTKCNAKCGSREIPKCYLKTFDKPDFNPRWDIGKYDMRVRLEQARNMQRRPGI